jgi:hypothetical protein
MNRRTPGPWQIDPANPEMVIHVDSNQDYEYICDCDPSWLESEFSWEQICLNARLIAAAPDLLEALEGLLPFFSPEFDASMEFKAGLEPFKTVLSKARAAIEKANHTEEE